ncbi:uncharacterized protein TrAtP1_007237 [Trichoderma atroviride]|uniref:Transcription factor domain-containing protein n=1 Tax=Hypocrea atroviridis (strain ATCC 20476 / IMI 206040) TaxID=452589 RepID=G9NFW1_HYPAI|nr:uncharacterized protein TRIATDRAFT_90624 [Trichoderma atroviride IMI 206040]EHK50173.1 hypothetical protein TRIATDRAFT_90624 [Trichoderma atroviride IMI 206040]UKZ66054.1 hypothetical protein TrAtP1_007237 [Trichoderma atroviride]
MDSIKSIQKGAEMKYQPDTSFRFIAIQSPAAAKDPTTRRLARSHAIKQAIRAKRELQERQNAKSPSITHESPHNKTAGSPSSTTSALSPSSKLFDLQTIDASRLKALIKQNSERQAAEPVFSLQEDVVEFQAFESVFLTGVDDPALLNAVMLTFALGVTDGNINQECLGYLNRATKSIRERMDRPENAASVAVIGAILLLAGVEARLGMRSQVQLHMKAIHQLLQLCSDENIYLNGSIKRAIFWQDLNCAVIAGSPRLFDHTTFVELEWRRDPFTPNFYTLSPGFRARAHLFPDEFIRVLEDTHALQCIRDSPNFGCRDTGEMMRYDSHQGSVQSRLVDLPKDSLFLECCYLAIYISACQLCSKAWKALAIPGHLSTVLLEKLRQADINGVWDDDPDLFLWLLYTGGAYLSTGPTRSAYIALINQKLSYGFGSPYKSMPTVLRIFKMFVWSGEAFSAEVERFWAETNKTQLGTYDRE